MYEPKNQLWEEERGAVPYARSGDVVAVFLVFVANMTSGDAVCPLSVLATAVGRGQWTVLSP